MPMPKPAQEAQSLVKYLEQHGCSFSTANTGIIIHDPKKFLEVDLEVKGKVNEIKLKFLAYLQHRALLRLLRVLEMAQPAIGEGMKEDYILALEEGNRIIGGRIWEDED